jgi:hypothetical protein
VQVRSIIEVNQFWLNLQTSLAFLQPFSDFIHQIEADRPGLGRCYEGLMTIDKHVRQSMEVWSKQPSLESESNVSVSTWERRLNGTGTVQALLQPAVAAF